MPATIHRPGAVAGRSATKSSVQDTTNAMLAKAVFTRRSV